MSVEHAWLGAVSSKSAWLRAKVSGESVRVAVSTSKDLDDPVWTEVESPTSDGMVSAELSDLEPDTRYWFGVEVDGEVDADVTLRARTHEEVGEPASFAFWTASCAGSGEDDHVAQRVSNHPVFATVADSDCLFGIHLGDMHYRDIGSGVHTDPPYDETRYREAFDDVLTFNGEAGVEARQAQLYRSTPIVYVWDDHDYGPNDSDGDMPHKDAAAAVYRERVPHYPLPASGAIYHSFQVGRVLFVCSDVRYDRSPNDDPDGPEKTMLGAAQIEWMEELLSTTEAEVLIWAMPSQWLADGEDTWGSFQHERDRLVEMLGAPGGDAEKSWLERMVMVSGDAHHTGISSGATNPWGGFPLGQFASLDSDPSSGNPDQWDVGLVGDQRGMWGHVQVDDSGSRIEVTMSGRLGDEEVLSHTHTVDAPTPSSGGWLGSVAEWFKNLFRSN